jgi:mannosyltransferase
MARRWVEATALGVLLAAPVVLTGIREHGQIAFLARRNYATFAPIAVQQWFGNPALAVLSWLLIVVAVVVAMRRRDRSIVPMVLWLLVPMAALLAVDKFITPTYSERYLSFCVPAAATLIALGIGALRKNWLMVVALASVIALAAPSYLQQRGPYGKDSGSDLRQVAQIVGSHASPGDAVVFDEAIKPSRKPRLALHLYPEDFVGLIDVGLRTSYVDRAGLWDSTLPVTAVGDRLASTTVVWALESSATSSPRDILDLKALGFVVHATYQSNRTTVYELRRDPS